MTVCLQCCSNGRTITTPTHWMWSPQLEKLVSMWHIYFENGSTQRCRSSQICTCPEMRVHCNQISRRGTYASPQRGSSHSHKHVLVHVNNLCKSPHKRCASPQKGMGSSQRCENSWQGCRSPDKGESPHRHVWIVVKVPVCESSCMCENPHKGVRILAKDVWILTRVAESSHRWDSPHKSGRVLARDVWVLTKEGGSSQRRGSPETGGWVLARDVCVSSQRCEGPHKGRRVLENIWRSMQEMCGSSQG